MKTQQIQQPLNEGLRPLDLNRMVHPIFEVDTFCSKMGEDRDVCVVSFQVKDRGPAKDLMEFFEKGYNFVLDADISSGETEDGDYYVFVEIPRNEELPKNIDELLYGVEKLTGLDELQFRYHKTPTLHDFTPEAIIETIPHTPNDYDMLMNSFRTEDIKRFFDKTLMDDLTVENDVITIHKPYGQKFNFKIISEDGDISLLENTEAELLTDEAMAEIFWLSKVIGNYDISKLGENLVFNNNNKSMILQRVE